MIAPNSLLEKYETKRLISRLYAKTVFHDCLFSIFKKSMYSATAKRVYGIYDKLVSRDPNQKEFLQAVHEVIESLLPLF